MSSIKRMLNMTLLAGVMGLTLTGTALASSEAVKAPTVSTPSWCGPPAYTKAQWLAGWRQNPALARSAEVWVRANARYTHIKADQGFMSWAMSPNIKVKTTPRGYVLSTNTSCPPGKGFSPYGGKLAHGGKAVVAWCNTSKTVKRQDGKVRTTYTETCTPLSKSYCRNLVTGRPFSKTWTVTKTVPDKTVPPVPPKPAPKPVPVPPGSCNAIDSPGAVVCSSYYVTVICGNLQQTFTGSSSDEAKNSANVWQQANCATAPPPAAPVPVPTCPVGTTGTWPFCSTPPPPAVTTTVRAITTHDVYSTGEADLCFTVSRSDGSAVDPGFITVAPAEGAMIPGTLKFVSGTGWCQRWKAPVTTVTHTVTWTAYAYGASSSNVMTVRPSDTGG